MDLRAFKDIPPKDRIQMWECGGYYRVERLMETYVRPRGFFGWFRRPVKSVKWEAMLPVGKYSKISTDALGITNLSDAIKWHSHVLSDIEYDWKREQKIAEFRQDNWKPVIIPYYDSQS